MIKCKLRLLMAENKINSIVELMEKTKLSRSAINRLYHERGMDTVRMDTLTAICDYFQVSLSDLIQYIPEPKK